MICAVTVTSTSLQGADFILNPHPLERVCACGEGAEIVLVQQIPELHETP